MHDLDLWKIKPKVRGIFDDTALDNIEKHIPSWRKIEDYCPIRHRASIIRVLRAINGYGLLINSAPRMWSVAQVATYLEVPSVVVSTPAAIPNSRSPTVRRGAES